MVGHSLLRDIIVCDTIALLRKEKGNNLLFNDLLNMSLLLFYQVIE